MADYSVMPIDIIRITQGQGGNTSHQGTYAIDLIGTHNDYPVHAPFKCKIGHAFGDMATGIHVFYHSVEPVKTPSGVKHMTALMVHTNKPLSYFLNHKTLGTVFTRSDIVYWTGVSGGVTGDHLHLEVADGHQTTLFANGHTNIWGGTVYQLTNSIPIEKGFYFEENFNYYSFIGGLTIDLVKIGETPPEGGDYIYIRKRVKGRLRTIPIRKRG